MKLQLSELLAPLGAELRGSDALISSVGSDSRALATGALFVALHGERFDGHDYLATAASAGAAAALVSRWVDSELPQIKVADTLHGLQQLAAFWRQRFRMPVIAVTGSNGKTTSKQMLASILATRGPVLATQGNLNNHIGVPLTLLQLDDTHRSAVIEMGANHLGEIALLTRLAQPDVGLITQAGDAHLEGFGSRDGVARGKGELFAGLRSGATAVINADDAYAPLWRDLAAPAQVLTFGFSARADVRATQLQELPGSAQRFVLQAPGGSAEVLLPLAGRHNVMNAIGAAACGIALGLTPAQIAIGLARFEAPQGRVSWKQTPEGAQLIDDSYNANPTSLQAGMELLAKTPGQRWLVLGGMAELGSDAPRLHREAGISARKLGIERLLAVGALAAEAAAGFGSGGESFADAEQLAAAIKPQLNSTITVLVKGSRSARMERVVAALTGTAQEASH